MRSPRGSRRSLAALAAALLAAGSLAGCGEEAPEEPERAVTILQDDAELLHRSDARVAAGLDAIRRLGVDWVRVTAGWSVIAPEPGAASRPSFDATDPGEYPDRAWDSLDRLERLASERGLDLAIDIAFWAPRWAVARPSGGDRERDGIDPGAYADFAEAVARRYPGARAFTIWNEPNFRTFLLPQWRREGGRLVPASPHTYREMVEAAVPRIRDAAPGALVLIGGTAALGTTEPANRGDGVPPLRFVREMACLDSSLRPLESPECSDFRPLPGDGFAHHPLSLDRPPWEPDPQPENVRMADLARLTGLLRRLHSEGRTERELPVYVTEYGYQTDPPDPTQPTTPAVQARWLPEAERIALTEPGVASHAQFLLRDLGIRPGDTPAERWRDSQMGLRFPDGRSKPAERSFRIVLSARISGPGRVAFWGRFRPARGPVEARIAIRRRGGWEPLAEARRTSGRGILEAEAETPADADYRLEVRSGEGPFEAGPAVRPVEAGR